MMCLILLNIFSLFGFEKKIGLKITFGKSLNVKPFLNYIISLLHSLQI